MLVVLLVFLVLITPVQLTLLRDGQSRITLRLWGLGGSFVPTLPAGSARQSRQFLRLMGTVLRTEKARRLFRRHVHVTAFQVLFRLHMEDAAATCLLTGLLQQLAPLLPEGADVRIQPEFIFPTRLQLRCILFFRLGTILIIAAMVLLAYLREGREHPLPHPKEA